MRDFGGRKTRSRNSFASDASQIHRGEGKGSRPRRCAQVESGKTRPGRDFRKEINGRGDTKPPKKEKVGVMTSEGVPSTCWEKRRLNTTKKREDLIRWCLEGLLENDARAKGGGRMV